MKTVYFECEIGLTFAGRPSVYLTGQLLRVTVADDNRGTMVDALRAKAESHYKKHLGAESVFLSAAFLVEEIERRIA